MKNRSSIVLFLISLVFISSTYAQTYIIKGAGTSLNYSTDKSLGDIFLDSQTYVNNIAQEERNNSAIINQIGDKNKIILKTQSNTSDVTILQQGDYNNALIKVKANSISETVLQIGNYHKLIDFSTSSSIHNLELTQNGNRQNLIWHGGNSISEELIISMKGENQSIIVRNFN